MSTASINTRINQQGAEITEIKADVAAIRAMLTIASTAAVKVVELAGSWETSSVMDSYTGVVPETANGHVNGHVNGVAGDTDTLTVTEAPVEAEVGGPELVTSALEGMTQADLDAMKAMLADADKIRDYLTATAEAIVTEAPKVEAPKVEAPKATKTGWFHKAPKAPKAAKAPKVVTVVHTTHQAPSLLRRAGRFAGRVLNMAFDATTTVLGVAALGTLGVLVVGGMTLGVLALAGIATSTIAAIPAAAVAAFAFLA